MLLISGEAYAMWPCTPLSQIAVDRAALHGAADRAEHIAYAHAGHLAGTPPGFAVAPSIRHPVDDVVYPFGGSRAGNNTARRDGWRRQVAFVRSAPSLCSHPLRSRLGAWLSSTPRTPTRHPSPAPPA